MNARRRPESARPRVGVFGRLGSGNIGNDASLEVVLAYLAREVPAAEIDCMCSGPIEVERQYGLRASYLHWMRSRPGRRSRWARAMLTATRVVLGVVIDTWRTASWVRRHDAVIIPGMGIFESTLPLRPWQLPYSLALLSLFGRLCNTKVAFVCVGASVVPERVSRGLLVIAARLAHYRSFRDEYSLEAARSMRLSRAHDPVYCDLVFALPMRSNRSGSSVGVGVMAYFGTSADRARAAEVHAAYVEQMKRFVHWLVETNHSVRLLIGDPADAPVAEAIITRVRDTWTHPAPLPVVFEPIRRTRELVDQVAALDAVVATRYHNVLVALACAKPTVAVGYGSKHHNLMARMTVAEFVQDIRSLDSDHLARQFTVLRVQRADVVRKLRVQTRMNQALLDRQFAELTAVLFASVDRTARS